MLGSNHELKTSLGYMAKPRFDRNGQISMIGLAVILIHQRWKQIDPKFKVGFGYIPRSQRLFKGQPGLRGDDPSPYATSPKINKQ